MDDKYEHGPLHVFEVIYTSGHVERIQAHDVVMPHDDLDLGMFGVRTASKLEKRWTFHGEFDGHWRLVLSVPAADVKSVRNVSLTADDLGGREFRPQMKGGESDGAILGLVKMSGAPAGEGHPSGSPCSLCGEIDGHSADCAVIS